MTVTPMRRATLEDMTADVLADYIRRGFQLVFYDARLKAPTGEDAKGWPQKTYTLADYRPGMNVGCKTGVPIAPDKHLTDVDIDWAGGLPLAERLLPSTGFVFGRASKPVSHQFYTTTTPVISREYKDIDNTMLVELRGTKQDGTIGKQTMMPPSVHPEGEIVELRQSGAISHNDALPHFVTLYAVACLLLKHLPPRGLKHAPRLALAGFLLRAGLDEMDVVAVGEAVAEVTGNDVRDVIPCVQDTAKKLKRGEKKVSGQKELVSALGEHGKAVVARLREWLYNETAVRADQILICGGALTEIVDRAETALLESDIPIYQRGGTLVRPITLDKAIADSHDVRRPAGATVLTPVNDVWLIEQMGRVLHWSKINANGYRQVKDPPKEYAHTLLGRKEWHFPVLRGVVTAPTLDRDGRIIASPGFDRASGLLLKFERHAFPPIPERPTKDDALAALERLSHPLRGFPFVDGAARAVALSAILTALIRGSLRTAPLHGFSAPVAGTGKTLLAEGVGLIATGCIPPAMSQGKKDDEDEKRLATVMFAGDPVIHIDNCDRVVSGDFLCSVATSEIVQARILGLSERRLLRSGSLILHNGQNLTYDGDASRRAVKSQLDAKQEQPDARVFDFDCHAEIRAARPELVVAGLTMLRAYVVCGGGEKKLTPMGSFEDYEWVRSTLVWLDCADPNATRAEILANDPRKNELLEVMDLWEQAFGTRSVQVKDIKEQAEVYTTDTAQITQRDKVQRLRDMLVDVACHGAWSSKSVGKWLRRHQDRVVGDRRFTTSDAGHNGKRWELKKPPKPALPL